MAGILLPAKVPNIQLTIYEKNSDFVSDVLRTTVSSQTDTTRAADGSRMSTPASAAIPSHVYQSTFEPKTDWSDQFAPGAEIRDYWQSVATKNNVHKHAKFNHRVDSLIWNEASSVWTITLTNTLTNTTSTATANFVLTAIGRFNACKLPSYPGIDTYRGILRQASHWNPSFDPTNKRVAVIGNGASGIQLVATLQKTVAHLDHYARNRTWIAASWAGDERTLSPQPYTESQKAQFASDPKAYLTFRKELEDKYLLASFRRLLPRLGRQHSAPRSV